ncbi:hypothetical protein GYMLUDRAFT_46917 [Collybiopsis luxurians FD-317 M1]|uniref:F-box domain-containing protein n=1 Tax=Collybiopsis luxurians FD-317 M1 TaxID=944289 RepID=A0A0D0CEV8_9AGAR|nr:hypothetical protein GYMLUDRAFT_46917 [Collybiopsis luxurians FD-317 M1]
MSQWEYSLTIGHCCKHDVVLPITQVCSHWREIAHSIPGLWASISVDLDFFRHGSLDISHIKQHLSRSRHVPLKIAVRGSPMSIGDIPFSKAEQLWMMLLEYSQTWNTLKLFVSNQSFLQASRFLALKGKDPFPNLRSITMPDMSNLHLLSVNFKRLTYLELSFYSGTSLEELFDSCNLLEVCILGGYRCEDPDKDANARPRILTHHHLRELHLRSEKNCSPHALLTLFFPNLKKLCLHKNTSYAHPHPAEIVALLRRESGGLPRCSLQSLHLAGYDGESADSILSSVQDSISTLSVHDYYCFLP